MLRSPSLPFKSLKLCIFLSSIASYRCFINLVIMHRRSSRGMVFGIGSAMPILGPRTIQHETVASGGSAAPAPTTKSMGSDGCNVHFKVFQDYFSSFSLFYYGN
ncbi:uncharacterized protein LOC127802489 [Diospyros lotus]|uniref:uncharacterized protein LOC127802489 n=1 Tax=Diospyros lotus TaxID=55363 RepID=UPI002259FCB7|nr:uncharacterized protein LOC127802489 [Diospyros lotus]